MKGSNKQFAKYLESEYKDYTLEPLEKEENADLNSLLKNSFDMSQTKPTESKERNHSPKVVQFTNFMVPLTQNVIKDFATLLGTEALEYCDGAKHIERVSNELFEAHKELYRKFQTVPILFLSFEPNKAVYVWQVNRVCPCKKSSNEMVLDTRSLALTMIPNISILMLAKIVPEEGEEILEAGFLGGNQFYVQSRIAKEQLVIRQYYLTDLVELARVNPFRQEILANNKHYCKLVIKGVQNTIEARERLDISLWKRKTAAEIEEELADIAQDEQGEEMKHLIREKLVQTNTNFEYNIISLTTQYGFGCVYGTQNNVSLLFDSYTGSVIAWREDGILASSFLIPTTTYRLLNIQIEKNSLFFKTDTTSLWQIIFETFPKVELVDLTFGSFIFNQWYGWDKEIRFQPGTSSRKMVYEDNANKIYDVRFSVINPHLKTVGVKVEDQQNGPQSNTKEDDKKEEEEKQEEIPLKSVDQIKSEARQKKNEKIDNDASLKSTKETLKDIRTGIRAQMTEIKKYEDECRTKEPKKSQEAKKVIQEPEGVSKEAIGLYNEMKTEKKRMERQREKEKGQRKDRRSKNDDF